MIVLKDDWQDAEAWDDFVQRHDQARFCHLFGYASVAACYGYVPRNICFARNGEIIGVLPAVQLKSLLSGRKLVSQPFSEYGGLLLDPRLSEGDGNEIFAALSAYAARHSDVGLVEMHGNHGVPASWRDNWTVQSIPHHVALLSLDRPVHELWSKVVRPSVRKFVTQAQKHHLHVVSECNENIIREKFFPLYLLSMKRLGVPPHDIRYFLSLFNILGDRMMIFWAKKGSATVAGLLGFSCSRRVTIISTVSDPGEWHLRPNDLLHWEFIKWAAGSDHHTFDFGSVRYQGQLDYKKKWGCKFEEHKYHLIKVGDSTHIRTLDSSSGEMRTMATLWSRYMPLAIGKTLGPIIRKQLAR